MNRIASRRPAASEWTLEYHAELIRRVEGECAIEALESQLHWICELAGHLSPVFVDTVHRPYRWTIRQVFEHCVDAERVFGYRMLRTAAGDTSPLATYDHDGYVERKFGLGNFSMLVTELGLVRQSNILLARRIKPACWDHLAMVDGDAMSFRAIAWVAAGHLLHHFEIIEKRVGITVPRTAPNS
ncbi:MAG: DinB family protein [Planctomycetota bacterium]